MHATIERRAALHAALGDPRRLGIVEELTISDRSPLELADRFRLPTNLLAHHLRVLEDAGLIERFHSTADRRRRYVRLRMPSLTDLHPGSSGRFGDLGRAGPVGPALFVCTQNSARSPLAAALWTARTGQRAASAGTHPAPSVHPGAIAAATRGGLDLHGVHPRLLDTRRTRDGLVIVVTVCDRAHEELTPPPEWRHWSIPDPVESESDTAFDTVLADLDRRITTLASVTA